MTFKANQGNVRLDFGDYEKSALILPTTDDGLEAMETFDLYLKYLADCRLGPRPEHCLCAN